MSAALSQLVWVVAVPALLGSALLRALGPGPAQDRLGRAAWAWLLGTLGLGALLFAWAALRLPWSASGVSAVALSGAIAAFLLARRRADEPVPVPAPSAPAGRAERWLFGAVLAFCLLVSLERMLAAGELPILRTDEAAIWAARAKAIHHAGGFGAPYLELVTSEPRLQHPDYPPLNPLLQLWVHVNAGRIVHFAPRLPIQLFVPAATLALASAFRARVRPAVAAPLLLLFPSLRAVGYETYRANADVMAAFGLLVALDALQRWRDGGGAAWLRLAALALGFLVATKNEGLVYLVALGLALGIGRWLHGRAGRPLRRPDLAWAIVPALVAAVHLGFNARYGFRDPMLAGGHGSASLLAHLREHGLERLGTVLRVLCGGMAWNARLTQLLVPAFAALVLLHPRRAFGRRLAVPTALIALVLAAYVGMYVASFQDVEWHLVTSAPRVVFQVLPALLVWMALAANELWPPFRPRRAGGEEAA